MNIGLAINEGFVKYAYVMLVSLFENNKDEKITVYLMYRHLSEESLALLDTLAKQYNQRLNSVCIGDEYFNDHLMHIDKWPVEVYFRLALPYILPESEDRILYLDSDIIINRSLKELYNTDLGENAFAACADISDGNLNPEQNKLFSDIVKEMNGTTEVTGEALEGKNSEDFNRLGKRFTYINTGVLLMNLKYLRENYALKDFIDKAIELKDRLSAPDQDLINYMFYKKILVLDSERYNFAARIRYNSGYRYKDIEEKNVMVIHFMGPKPWSTKNLRTDVEKVWWKYAEKTPLYYTFLEEILMGEIEQGYDSTNEFWYVNYQKEQLEKENAKLKKSNEELLAVMKEAKAVIEGLYSKE